MQQDLSVAQEIQRQTQERADLLRAQQETLREAEERTRLILDSAAEGIFGVDTEGRITFVNPACCRMLGYAPEEMLGQPSHQLIHHHHADGSAYPREKCPMFAAYARGEASRIDDEFLWRKDGTGLPVEYGATPIRKDGALVGAVISFTDITERRRAEARLRETEQFFRSVLELAPDGLMIVNARGVIQLANAQCESLFGYTRQGARSASPWRCSSPPRSATGTRRCASRSTARRTAARWARGASCAPCARTAPRSRWRSA